MMRRTSAAPRWLDLSRTTDKLAATQKPQSTSQRPHALVRLDWYTLYQQFGSANYLREFCVVQRTDRASAYSGWIKRRRDIDPDAMRYVLSRPVAQVSS